LKNNDILIMIIVIIRAVQMITNVMCNNIITHEYDTENKEPYEVCIKKELGKEGLEMIFGLGKPNIEKMENKKDIEGLIKALNYKKDDDIRKTAASILGKFGDARAVEPLLYILKFENEYLRRSAAEALGMIGDPMAVEPLIKALKDESYNVQSSAAIALGKINDARAVKPLKIALKNGDNVREAAKIALDKISG
jgi:HEAT repeat protein